MGSIGAQQLYRQREGARGIRRCCRNRVRPFWCSRTTRRSRTGDRDSVLAARHRTHSQRPDAARAGAAQAFDPSGTYAAEDLSAAGSRTRAVGRRPCGAGGGVANTRHRADGLPLRPGGRDRGPPIRRCSKLARLVEPSLGWGQLDDAARACSSGSSRGRSISPRPAGPGSCRIDAHSAAGSPAWCAAAPAYVHGDQGGGTPVKNCTTTWGLRQHQCQQHVEPDAHRPWGGDRRQAGPTSGDR